MADAYLDSSALIKRYVQEPGTNAVDIIFDRASIGALAIATSVWNLGEAFGVFDHRRQRKLLTEHEFRVAVRSLTNEVVSLMRTGALQVYPVRTSMLTEAWSLVFNQHLDEADALQIVTCNSSESKVLITSDEVLRRATEGSDLRVLDPHRHEREIRELFK
jgi:predicted nucleic acid-binding protein